MAARRALRATYEAAPNIALVKYWGVRDLDRGLPYNSSLSVTLDRFRTRTTVAFDPSLPHDAFVLGGRRAFGAPLDAVAGFLDRVRTMAARTEHARVRSTNNFPTASGLASSASGFAALAGAASRAAGLDLDGRALSQLARSGSGSACRSIFGGFVEWQAGSRSDGSDCFARPLYDEHHWPDLVDLVAVVRDAPVKPVRSAVAMQSSVETAPGYWARQEAIPQRIDRIRRAIAERDAEELFTATMEECDDFREVCETSRPSLDYLTPTSRELLAGVRELNAAAGHPLAGYTHDAGAHVHVFTLREDLPVLKRSLGTVAGVAEWITVGPGRGGRSVPAERPATGRAARRSSGGRRRTASTRD